MPRRNRGWLSNRATRMRSAKGGLQLCDFELRRVGHGIGKRLDRKFAADGFDAVVESAQPLRVVGGWCVVGCRAPHFYFQHLPAARGPHRLGARALIERLAHEAVEA